MQTENNMTLLVPPQVAPVMREALATETENRTMGVAASFGLHQVFGNRVGDMPPFADDGAA